MNRPIYNKIGKTYNQTRSADPRIVDKLVELLDLPNGSQVLDVGAGTGSYSQALSKRGYRMTALEPSEVMQRQKLEENEVKWESGVAESLPFNDNEFDAAIYILSIHHFIDLRLAFEEASRVTKKAKVIIFTYDPSAIDSPWLFQYFPVFRDQIKKLFPTISKLKRVFPNNTDMREVPFPLPHDLQDGFAGAAWRHPERYLEEDFRSGTSAFQLLCSEDLVHGLTELEKDLKSGIWDDKYGNIKTLSEYDHGYTFLLMSSF